MIRYLIHCIFLMILLLSMAACKTQNAQSTGKQKNSPATSKKEASNTAVFIEAIKEKTNGNFEMAANLFKKSIQMDSADAASYYELAQVSTVLNNHEDALEYAQKAYELDPENEWYGLLLARMYKSNGKYDKSLEVWESILARDPENIDYLFELSGEYIFAGEYEKSLELLERIENMIGVNEEVSLQKQKLYRKTGNEEKELGELKKLIEAFPAETRYFAILAETYMNKGMDEKALETYKKILEIAPQDPYIHISLSDYYRKKGEMEKAFEELNLGFANPQLNIDTKIQILLAYYATGGMQGDNKQQANILAKSLIEAHPDEPKAYSIYGDLLYQQEEFEKAREAYRQVLSYDSSKYMVWEQLLFVESELEDYRSMKKESEAALELFPQQALLYLFAGVSNFQLENYRKVIDLMERGANFIINNDALLAQFYSNIGDAYNELSEHEKSDEYYEKALDIEPENALVLNNYAYYLSLRNKDLSKAEEMAQKAVEIDSTNSANLDTYAWVLYKLEKYEEALAWIKKAMEHGGDEDDTILEHYGDILYRLGNEKEAVEYWKKAAQKGKGTEFLHQKIRDGKLYE